jgi:hypothetical protein
MDVDGIEAEDTSAIAINQKKSSATTSSRGPFVILGSRPYIYLIPGFADPGLSSVLNF